MLMILFKIIAGIFMFVILLAFVFIDLIHAYCRKHVDRIDENDCRDK